MDCAVVVAGLRFPQGPEIRFSHNYQTGCKLDFKLK